MSLNLERGSLDYVYTLRLDENVKAGIDKIGASSREKRSIITYQMLRLFLGVWEEKGVREAAAEIDPDGTSIGQVARFTLIAARFLVRLCALGWRPTEEVDQLVLLQVAEAWGSRDAAVRQQIVDFVCKLPHAGGNGDAESVLRPAVGLSKRKKVK